MLVLLVVAVVIVWFLLAVGRKRTVREVVQHVEVAERRRAANYMLEREEFVEPSWKVKADSETVQYAINFSEMTLEICQMVGDEPPNEQTFHLQRLDGAWSAKGADSPGAGWTELERDLMAEVEKRYQQLQIFMATGRGTS